ncbi:MAG: menaquinone biosynthesis decarboxylase [Bacteroidales bacterium]|jgi:4-hydroxy-3-polyprenylbenzoate decarboxylase|nr:menaquinone biosynthesis decarboxylase [Bacteroidales bacterium]
MAYKSLNDFIAKLDSENELIRIKEFVDPELEITEIVDRISKSPEGGKAILFENTGTEFPVLINAMGSERRMCMSLGVDNLDDIGKEIEKIFIDFTSPKVNIFDKLKLLPKLSSISSWMPKSISGKGSCQDIIIKNPDLSKFPILKCWPEDGGPFVTLPMVITKDPITGIRNVGMYRMQIFDKNVTGMHWHKHKVGARHFDEYKKLGKKIPIAVALGGDPAYTYAATAPVPDNVDEFLLAGFLRKQKVELVKCITQDIEAPADADIIIEGYVDPKEDFIWEGPFGDHTGFYSLADWYPKLHVTCVTHKKHAVYPATIVGVPPMEDAWIGKATERIFLSPIRLAILPEILDYDLPFEGVAHNIAIVKIHKTYPGQAFKVMSSMWGAGQMMFNKIMIVVDEKIDIHDYSKLAKTVYENTDPQNDIHFINGPADVLDHSSSKFTFGSKMGIDATIKFPEELILDEETRILRDIGKIELMKKFIEILDINLLPEKGIMVISVKKDSKLQIEKLSKNISDLETLNFIKFVFIVDSSVDVNDLNMIAWIVSGNIDPKRDSMIIKSTENKGSKIFFDATKKSFEKDKFTREWPNIVVSNDETISIVDNKWNKLGLGAFIKSPSLKYRKLNNNLGAVSKEKKDLA